ncbi:MutS-related protein [Sphingobacterium griseoflavum]|uniref:DNA mismatch repair proteins mutS family domain-containing protein n=1 Tax=Sphingobacterium griseoflavum TaxID=1474952 RepID=A0ABQ3HSH0_9SPHI|nr:AAA family ATPase [Sphingobacterium griseoflavum]GHE30289.1 hypothetical protein GCM10017764_11510 [Sphingobacterium griseoflavum]
MFKTDQQTLTDINALDWNSRSLLHFFDHTLTLGGRDVLYGCLLLPLCEKDEIVKRQETIAYLAKLKIDQLFDKYMMVDLESYLQMPQSSYSPSLFIHFADKLSTNFLSLAYQKERLFIRQSVREIATLLIGIRDLLASCVPSSRHTGILATYAEQLVLFWKDLDEKELHRLSKSKSPLRLVLKYDYIFRSVKKNIVQEVFKMLYTLDALYAVSKVWNKGGLCFPRIRMHSDPHELLTIKGMYNLGLDEPIKNDIHIHASQNIWFLTGANMTGKSTLLRSIASCMHLAHAGFPVPALSMGTVLFKGMMTSINLADSLGAGYSHFFAEVNRLKTMADNMATHGPMIIMLDEIFKGTNYRDAYEATSQLIDHISGIDHSIFFISTHMTDLGTALKGNARIAPKYLATKIDAKEGISFTYTLTDGIATDKLGMWFLKREGVFQRFQTLQSKSDKA